MKKLQLLLIYLFMTTGTFAQSGIFYNVIDYGAKGDGQTIDTKAIDAAIVAASEKGGGTVFFPAGTYLSFTIHLKNFITPTLFPIDFRPIKDKQINKVVLTQL